MSQRIGTDDEVTKRILHSLSCNPKYKVVKKQGGGNPKVINADDTFVANDKFTSKVPKHLNYTAPPDDPPTTPSPAPVEKYNKK